MQKLLQSFHHEHVAMQRLINEFDQEVELMRDNRSDPDYHLLLEMVRNLVGMPSTSIIEKKKSFITLCA